MRVLPILRLWLPVALWVALLFVLSEQSSVPAGPGGADKLAHVVAHAVLGVLSLRAFHGGMVALRPVPCLAALALTVGHGALDEFHQSFVPGRTSSLGDFAADAAGALVAVLLVMAARRRGSGSARTGEL